MLDQCLALLELKFLLMRRTWTSSKWISIGVFIALLLLGGVLAIALSVAMFLLGARWLAKEDAFIILISLDFMVFAFLFFWFWGLLMEVQRSDIIDLRPMLFLPISLPMVFLMNFAVSLFSVSFLFIAPSVFAFLAGLAVSHGAHVLLGVPLAMSFFLMLAAWAYYARGLLAILMENKRRRRVVLTILPLFFVFLGQLPNIILHTSRSLGVRFPDMSQTQLEQALAYGHAVVPLGWLPYGVSQLLDGRVMPCFLGFAGFAAITLLGLILGFRSTLRYYTGAHGGRGAAKKMNGRKRNKTPLTARRFPLLPDDVSAMTFAEFLGYARHPQIRMLMIMPLCMGLLFLFMYRTSGDGGGWVLRGPWTPLLVLLWPFFNFSLMLFNVFGVDKQAFRGMVLLPVARHKFIFAKNLALFPFVAGMSGLMVVMGALLTQVQPRYVAISITQIIQLYLMYCIVGNFLSVFFPYRITRDSMRARGNHPMLFLLGLASTALAAVMMLPTTLCMVIDDVLTQWWGFHGVPVGWFLSLGLLAGTAALYWRMLIHSGDLLLAREQKMLDTLVRDRE